MLRNVSQLFETLARKFSLVTLFDAIFKLAVPMNFELVCMRRRQAA